MTRHGAFTAIELMTGLLVITIVAAVALVSPKMTEQTAKREAERLQAYLYLVMQSSDRRMQDFDLDTFSDYISVKWMGNSKYVDKSFKASHGCIYSDNFQGTNGKTTYSAKKKLFYNPGTITINDVNGKYYYVIIAGITEGRVRISDTAP